MVKKNFEAVACASLDDFAANVRFAFTNAPTYKEWFLQTPGF